MPDRRYDEDEVARILRQATERNPAALAAGSGGLTLAQVQEIAAQVGIDARAVAAAARDLDTRRAVEASPILGSAVAPQYEMLLDGRVDPARYPDALLAIRRAMGRQGVVSTELNGLEWRARDAMGGRYVSIQPSGERTLVRVFGNFRDGAMMLYAMVGTAGGAAALVLGKALGIGAAIGVTGAFPLVLLAGYLPARLVLKWRARKEDEQLRAVLANLAEALGAGDDPEPGG